MNFKRYSTLREVDGFTTSDIELEENPQIKDLSWGCSEVAFSYIKGKLIARPADSILNKESIEATELMAFIIIDDILTGCSAVSISGEGEALELSDTLNNLGYSEYFGSNLSCLGLSFGNSGAYVKITGSSFNEISFWNWEDKIYSLETVLNALSE